MSIAQNSKVETARHRRRYSHAQQRSADRYREAVERPLRRTPYTESSADTMRNTRSTIVVPRRRHEQGTDQLGAAESMLVQRSKYSEVDEDAVIGGSDRDREETDDEEVRGPMHRLYTTERPSAEAGQDSLGEPVRDSVRERCS